MISKDLSTVPLSHHKAGIQQPLQSPYDADVDLCSHVGGHAFAGNVIIYLPVDLKLVKRRALSPLAGKCIWYGRVEPSHVEGIISETLMGGRIIEELCRGIHDFPVFEELGILLSKAPSTSYAGNARFVCKG